MGGGWGAVGGGGGWGGGGGTDPPSRKPTCTCCDAAAAAVRGPIVRPFRCSVATKVEYLHNVMRHPHGDPQALAFRKGAALRVAGAGPMRVRAPGRVAVDDAELV